MIYKNAIGGDHQAATIIVAASDSTHPERADYLCSGTDDQVIIQAAVDSGGDIYFMDGNYSKSNMDGISLISNTKIQVSNDATFKLVDGLNVDACFFKNADKTNGNENIDIIGGTFDCNRAGQSAGYQFLSDFENVRGGQIDSRIIGFTVLEAKLKTSSVELHNSRYDVEPIVFAPCENVNEFTISGDTCTTESGGVVGDNCIKMVAVAPQSAIIDKVLPDGIDVEAYVIDCWIKIDDITKCDMICIGGDSPGTFSPLVLKSEVEKLMKSDKWYHVQAPLKYYTLSGHSTLRTRIFPATGQTVTMYVCNIGFLPVTEKARVSFQFDDAWESAAYKTIRGAEIMSKYGYSASVNQMGSGFVGGDYLSVDELELLYSKYGWDICTHAYTHWEAGVSVNDAKRVSIENRKWIENNGWSRGAPFLVLAGHDTRGEITDVIPRFFAGYRTPLKVTVFGLCNVLLNYSEQAHLTATTYAPSAREMECMRRHIWLQRYTHYIAAGQMTPEYLDAFCSFWYDWGVNLTLPSSVFIHKPDMVAENSGTATLANGTTSIVVTHELTVTPVVGDIVVTPTEAWGNMTQFYIDTYTSTQFTIRANINPGQDVDFAWKAIVL